MQGEAASGPKNEVAPAATDNLRTGKVLIYEAARVLAQTSEVRGPRKTRIKNVHAGARTPRDDPQGALAPSRTSPDRGLGEKRAQKQLHQEGPAGIRNPPTCFPFPRASRTQRSELLLPFTPKSQPSSRLLSQGFCLESSIPARPWSSQPQPHTRPDPPEPPHR